MPYRQLLESRRRRRRQLERHRDRCIGRRPGSFDKVAAPLSDPTARWSDCIALRGGGRHSLGLIAALAGACDRRQRTYDTRLRRAGATGCATARGGSSAGRSACARVPVESHVVEHHRVVEQLSESLVGRWWWRSLEKCVTDCRRRMSRKRAEQTWKLPGFDQCPSSIGQLELVEVPRGLGCLQEGADTRSLIEPPPVVVLAAEEGLLECRARARSRPIALKVRSRPGGIFGGDGDPERRQAPEPAQVPGLLRSKRPQEFPQRGLRRR